MKIPKRELLGRTLYRTGLLHLWHHFVSLARSRLVIIAYHRVVAMPPKEIYPFDSGLVSATPENFDWQLRFLRRNFDVVAFSDVINHLDRRQRLPRRPVVITFDDGFDDNYHVAYPLLRSHGLAATFFVCTGYIGRQESFWFDELAHLVMRVPPGSIELAEAGISIPIADDVGSRRHAVDDLLRAMKNLSDAPRREFLQHFYDQYGSYRDPSARRQSLPMTWPQIIEMSAGGMEFGSHSVSHPILSSLDDASLAREMSGSKHELESRLEKRIDTISYPEGSHAAFDARVIQAAVTAGYRLGCSYMSGMNQLSALARFQLRRQPIENHESRVYFRGQLIAPGLIR
jgi:peptidoglycan/xylan/chitin deacetylase (PgdA/CDA1 family)